jgi:hypothetical protein
MVKRARAHVIDELTAEAIATALPADFSGIDVLAFVESRTERCGLVPVPIRIVVSRGEGLLRCLQGARALGMLVALVWEVGEPAPTRSFALTAAELTLVKMIALMNGAHAAPVSAGAELVGARRETIPRNAIEPFAMSRGQWRKKLMGCVEGNPESDPCCRQH